MTWVENVYSVGEEDGQVTACLQLNGVMEPTESDVWVSLVTMDGAVALCKSRIEL